ncbi:MAG: ABC transporter permease [Spirochaetaceae bacterium]|jgi:ribose transport system permease protein|nr:ABC transporter permease [Spirochaetaceae bacterium]
MSDQPGLKSGGAAVAVREYVGRFKWSEHSTGLAFILLFILATVVGWPNFLQIRNLTNILRQQSYTGIIALGMTLVIISGGIDLSVGSMMAFVGGVTIYLLNTFPGNSLLGVIAAFLFALVFGTFTGLVNGLMVTRGRIAPFIATLGTMSIFRSLIQYFSGASNIVSKNTIYPLIGSGIFLGIPVPVWVFLILAGLLHVVLNNTRFGRYVCAVGANEQVARYSAINVRFIKLIPYAITGFTVAVTALLWSTRINCIQSSGDGTGYELEAIAAVVIGGTSMSGGKGSIIGTVMGAIMLGMINNMLVLGGVSSFLQQAARGLVIIAAVLLQYNNNNK